MSNNKRSRPRLFPSAKATIPASRNFEHTPQTASASYRLAFADDDFMVSDETRAIRLQLEWMKFDQLLDNAQIDNTIVIFGSARIGDPHLANSKVYELKRQLHDDGNNESLLQQLKQAQHLQQLCVYYEEARKFAHRVGREGESRFGFASTIITGGGPGIMEGANRGAFEAGSPSIGLNIVLPAEQHPNPYVTPNLSFQFHYFAIRKMHFLMRARAIVVFPGGYGTLDEFFETLTLRQTGRVGQLPILLCGREYWRKVINFDALVEAGVIGSEDLNLFHYVDNADQAFEAISDYYQSNPLVNLPSE